MEWTDERVERLRELWAAGYSARQIADRLGGITRNAVIGKANRMGLSKPTRSSVTRAERAEERIEEPPAEEEPSSSPCTVLTLTPSTCRWPVGHPGDDNFHFCGARAPREQPYCQHQARMAYQVPTPKEARRAGQEKRLQAKRPGWAEQVAR